MSLALLCSAAGAHAYYVTVCQIDHNVAGQALEITFKFFTDDLERALRNAGSDDLRLQLGSEPDDIDPKVFAYVESHLTLIANGAPLKLLYVGKEVELDVTYVYVEAIDVPRLETVMVQSRILLELFDEHTTIVNLKTVGQEKSLLLRKDSESGLLELKLEQGPLGGAENEVVPSQKRASGL